MLEQKEILKKLNQSILTTSTKDVLIEGQGHNFEEAVANAFEKLKIVSYNMAKNMLISMNTLDVILLDHQVKEKTLKLPGKKETHKVSLEIKLEIKDINI